MADHGPAEMEMVEVKSEDILAERRAFYDTFMSSTTWAVGGIIGLLALMWFFLV